MRARRACLLVAAALSILAAQSASAQTAGPIPPGYRPTENSNEAGVWLQSDDAEKLIQQSPALVRDEPLNAYVKDVFCRVAADQCGSTRVYIMTVPDMNAYCLPNGAIVVWTGLLLRMENEAQLAFLLGHELTHYTHRHGFQGQQSLTVIRDALAILSLGAAVATVRTGVDFSSALTATELLAVGAFFSYSRDQEREADSVGFGLAISQDYDPRQGSALWTYVDEEEKANPRRQNRLQFLSTHPSSQERIANFATLAEGKAATSAATESGAERFRSAMAPHRAKWLETELQRSQFAESIVLLKRLLKSEDSGELHFYLAEAYRRRNDKGDLELAVAAFQTALSKADAPVTAHRGLGLAALRSGKRDIARDAFQAYLAAAPQADDRAMVQLYLTNLGVPQ